MTSAIQPFEISVPDLALESLKTKLSHATFPDESPMSDSWEYGAPVSDLKRLVSYWKDGFDWRAAEAKLNKLPQYTTPISIDGFGKLNIHFIHQTSDRPGSIPLLFCHGCELQVILSALVTRTWLTNSRARKFS